MTLTPLEIRVTELENKTKTLEAVHAQEILIMRNTGTDINDGTKTTALGGIAATTKTGKRNDFDTAGNKSNRAGK